MGTKSISFNQVVNKVTPNFLKNLPARITNRWETSDRIKLSVGIALFLISAYFSLHAFAFSISSSVIITSLKCAIAVALGVLGTHFVDESRNTFRDPKIPFPGQRNSFNTCFINSLFTLLYEIPEFKAFMKNPPTELKAFKTYTKSFEEAIVKLGLVSKKDSQMLRRALFPEAGVYDSSFQDPHETLTNLALHIPETSPLKVQVRSKRRIDVQNAASLPVVADNVHLENGVYYFQGESREIPQLSLRLPIEKSVDFMPLLRQNFFGNNTQSNGDARATAADGQRPNYPVFEAEVEFTAPPSYLFVKANRFTNEGAFEEAGAYRYHKVTTQLKNVPFDLVMPGATVGQAEDHNYPLTGFLIHEGNEPTGGHYLSYTLKNDKWYKRNDGSVVEVSLEQVRKAAEKAYMFLYRHAG